MENYGKLATLTLQV